MMPEVFGSPFMQKAFLAGILVSILTGLISVFIVLRKMSFIGAGISHAAFGGIAIGFFTGMNPLVTAILYSILVAIGIESTGRKGKISEDASIGIFYSVSMALGIALLSLSKSYNVDLFGYLFGNILAISRTDILLTVITFVVVSGFILMFLKELFLSTYNEELAKVDGVPVVLLNTFFLIALAVSIVISIRIVGIILVSALLVIPGATARLFAKGLISMLVLSCLTGVASVIFGLLISYQYDIAPGACIVLVSALIFFFSVAAKKKR
ncbi:MAG: metal ABC transporter permease [Nitrospirota bacterium]|nr:metal ABC transporter permease [Nitrospirota bacterium]